MALRRRSRVQKGDDGVVVVGVVHPSGPGALQTPPSREYVFRFGLQPWRETGGQLNEAELSVSKIVSPDRVDEHMNRIDSYDVVRVRVDLAADFEATLIEILGLDDSDEELARRAVELREPVTTDSDYFGTLTLDRELVWWETEQQWAGEPVTLSLSPTEDGDVGAASEAAEALWRSQPDWDRSLRARAIDELLELKNESWRDEGEAEVTVEEFGRRMKPESVTVYADGDFEFWFGDDGLFLGHSIVVRGRLAGGATDADIAG